ncbi:MAG: hypothetical protein M1832_003437 [Thelocarpon impressellum]|nr:MAG: hypothetical protein M1832_003437 [Thelocarpon impressellum]
MATEPQSPQARRVTADTLLDQSTVASEDAPAELTAVVDDLLATLSNKFSSVASEIFAKMDDMSRRLDNLEENLQAGGGDGEGNKSGKS